jgi:hypothetical protein
LRRENELAALPVDLRDPRLPSSSYRHGCVNELLHMEIDGPVDVRYEQAPAVQTIYRS